ncbi:MAG: carboxypeptidase regulatory-like domain-containing protein, partial [Actinobacteria bacterium]|nr:carboxypeptidase regulatory-like domain-containing protein [Actinomycetota bacterium]
EDGFPIAGARISLRSLRPDAPARRTTFSNDDGTVEVPGMPTPPWRVEIDQEGYALEVLRRVDEAEPEH